MSLTQDYLETMGFTIQMQEAADREEHKKLAMDRGRAVIGEVSLLSRKDRHNLIDNLGKVAPLKDPAVIYFALEELRNLKETPSITKWNSREYIELNRPDLHAIRTLSDACKYCREIEQRESMFRVPPDLGKFIVRF